MNTPDVFIGIDIGGTRTKAVAADRDGTILADLVVPTPRTVTSQLADHVADLLTEMDAALDRPGVALGVAVPGIVDERSGIAIWSANLGWRDLPLRDQLRHRIQRPLVVGHDVRSGLLAELRFGAAQGARDALFIPIGTGISGAILSDGRLVSGRGYAGELGHLVAEPDGPQCGCGARGCLEAVASASALARAYAARRRLDPDQVTAADVVNRLGHDADADELWARAVERLAEAIVTVTTASGADLVVIGGGLSNAGAALFTPLRSAVSRRATLGRSVRIVAAQLGDQAGALGAACLAMDAQAGEASS